MNTKLKDQIIISESAQKMMTHILPFYNNDEYVLSIFQTQGIEFDAMYSMIESFKDQPYPSKATWSLKYWEQLFGLPDGSGDQIAERRRNITNFVNAKQPINKNRIEVIASDIAGVPVVVYDFFKEYTFFVVLVADDFGVINREISRAIFEAKPAHLAAEYYVKIKENLHLYDPDKKTIVPVSEFYNNIGKGSLNNSSINITSEDRAGIFLPSFSGEIIGGEKAESPKSRNKTTKLSVFEDIRLGTATPKDSPMENEQMARSSASLIGMNANVRNGKSYVRFCGEHYAGEG